jgi:hypothetical protein
MLRHAVWYKVTPTDWLHGTSSQKSVVFMWKCLSTRIQHTLTIRGPCVLENPANDTNRDARSSDLLKKLGPGEPNLTNNFHWIYYIHKSRDGCIWTNYKFRNTRWNYKGVVLHQILLVVHKLQVNPKFRNCTRQLVTCLSYLLRLVSCKTHAVCTVQSIS